MVVLEVQIEKFSFCFPLAALPFDRCQLLNSQFSHLGIVCVISSSKRIPKSIMDISVRLSFEYREWILILCHFCASKGKSKNQDKGGNMLNLLHTLLNYT